jgi:hypothetical protein
VSTARQFSEASRSADYAVAWCDGDGEVASGRLILEHSSLVLRGTGNDGGLRRERVPLEQVAGVRIGRKEPERVRGERSVVLELRDGSTVRVAPVGAAGAVFELADLVAELSSEQRAYEGRVGVVLPLRRGTAARARELVSSGPPFDVERAGLDAHEVFVSDREVVFLFEGGHAREVVEQLLRDPRVLREAARWRECLAGRPRIAEATYAWQRGIA